MKIFVLLCVLSSSCFGSLAYPFPSVETEKECLLPPMEVLFLKETSKKNFEEILYEKSKTLEEKLNKVIFGQEYAIRETVNALIRYAAGINNPNGVIAFLLYCGPSGVGKTELASRLALELFGDSSHFIQINMSEYVDFHHINRLIGAPPGYVGYESGGQLTNAILANPNSVVLLDEIEKAHRQIRLLFLHIFDKGIFTSARGQIVDCRKCIFISTSNLASLEIAQLKSEGLSHDEIVEELKPFFMDALTPELYNRYELLIFNPLSQNLAEKLVLKKLQELKELVFRVHQIELIFDLSLISYLKNKGIDPLLGARPLSRLVEKELITLVAKAILDGNFKKKDKMKCSYCEGYIVIEKF